MNAHRHRHLRPRSVPGGTTGVRACFVVIGSCGSYIWSKTVVVYSVFCFQSSHAEREVTRREKLRDCRDVFKKKVAARSHTFMHGMKDTAPFFVQYAWS